MDNIMLDKMKTFLGRWSTQAEEMSAMSESDLTVWQNFGRICVSCDAVVFLLYFWVFFRRYALIQGWFALLRAGTFLIEGRVGRYVLLGDGRRCWYALFEASRPY